METVHNILYKLTALIIRTFCRLNGGLEVRGKEHIPAQGGVLVASNHISYLDPPVVGAVLPRRGNFMARKGLFDIPVLGWMIGPAAFPVDRKNVRPSTIKEAVRRLRDGKIVVVFPEGQRSETGELLEARRGVGMIANLGKVPVVPAFVRGTNRVMPVGDRRIHRAKVTVTFGKPMYLDPAEFGNKGLDGHRIHDIISEKIMDSIRELMTSNE